jgi:general secretion pathway protein D
MLNYSIRRHEWLLHMLFVALSALPLCTYSQESSANRPKVVVGPKANTQSPVTLNFVNTDIDGVVRAVAAMIDRQIILDPRVKSSNMTLYSETPVTITEAFLLFQTSLRGMGFAVVETAGVLRVVPEAEAKIQSGTVSVGSVGVRGDQVITQIFKLNHESANNLVPILRPLISPNNIINANASTNSLVITDYADNLQRIAQIIATLDQPSVVDVEVVPLQNAMANDIAPMVQRLMDSSGASGGGSIPAGAPTGMASGVSGANGSVLVDTRSNSFIVRAPNAAKLEQIKAIINKLDYRVTSNGDLGNVWVVYLKNADAVRLATVLRAAFPNPTSQGQGSMGGGGGLTSSSSFSGAPTGSSGGTSAQATSPIQSAAAPSVGGFIQADPATNALIITAHEALYKQVRAVIDQLDSRRAQIYVESLIVKVDANKAAEFGVQWQSLLANEGKTLGLAAGSNFGSGGSNLLNLSLTAGTAEATKSLPGNGFNLGILNRTAGGLPSLAALARFLETETGANVLSTPNLVALDNEEAKIVIGQNVPFITGSFSNNSVTTGSVNPFQTIERKDVGLTLRIRSQIGENGTVRMQVFQENSSVVPSANSNAGPTTDKSSIETSVVVDDGQTIVLGGLLKDEYTDSEDKVPGLSALPVMGGLFKRESRSRNKSNLMVFLRPVVIRTQNSFNDLTLNRYEFIRAQQPNPSPATSTLPISGSNPLPPLSEISKIGKPGSDN